MSKTKAPEKTKRDSEDKLGEELEMTFPASDPPAATQPGGGVTGPDDPLPAPTPTGGRGGAPTR